MFFIILLGLVISCQAQENDLSKNFNKASLASVYDGAPSTCICRANMAYFAKLFPCVYAE